VTCPTQADPHRSSPINLARNVEKDVPGVLHCSLHDPRGIAQITATARTGLGDDLNTPKAVEGGLSLGRCAGRKHGDGPHQNNVELGKHGRNRSNVWTYAGVNTFRAGRLDELALHPTVKPVALVTDAIRDCSRRGDVILDPFLGSGTTVLAAERVGRRAFGIELDPTYVDVAVRRWQSFTKRDAILAVTGTTFDEIAAAGTTRKIRRVR